jgi:hypothetical protein
MSDRVSGVIPLQPQGTNSTIFTDCCQVAICDNQARCPHCGLPVIGWDEPTTHLRGRARWRAATFHWRWLTATRVVIP